MNGYEILGVALLSVAVVIGLLWFLAPYLKAKNVPVDDILDKVDDGIDKVDDALTALNNVASIPYFGIIDKVLEYAKSGVGKIEELYKMGELEKDARKESAKQFIVDELKKANVEVSEDLEKVISGAIDYSVTLLPKTFPESSTPVESDVPASAPASESTQQ